MVLLLRLDRLAHCAQHRGKLGVVDGHEVHRLEAEFLRQERGGELEVIERPLFAQLPQPLGAVAQEAYGECAQIGLAERAALDVGIEVAGQVRWPA